MLKDMAKQDIPTISPLIQKWHPNMTPAEQRAATADLRHFLGTLMDAYEALKREGRLPPDSEESRTHGNLESE
jgi:hypothetical protein